MTIIEPIFTELALAGRLLVNISCAECRKNPTDDLVADSRSQTDRRTSSLHSLFLFYVIRTA